MNWIAMSGLVATFLFLGLVFFVQAGVWAGRRRRARRHGDPDVDAGLPVIDGAVFALLGLLIAFTFTGAAARFDTRRDLIVEHVNTISTAWARLDMLEENTDDELRALFREFVDSLLIATRNVEDRALTAKRAERVRVIEERIWELAANASKTQLSQPLGQVLLPAINTMIDTTTSRLLAARRHPPAAIFILLGVVAVMSAVLAGFGISKAKSESWVHVLGFSLILALAIYLILDLEFPRLGLIRLDRYDQAFVELRESMR